MNALFRCDATAEIGFGHLSRSIALAEALRLFAVQSTFAGMFDPAAEQQIDAAGFDWVDFPAPVNTQTAKREFDGQAADLLAADFLVIDSYRIDEAYLADLKSLGQTTVVIDDFCALAAYSCDVLLNFTQEASSLDYPEGPTLLLGPQFLLVRRQLVARRADSIRQDRRGAVRKLLVVVGGADPKHIAARLVKNLSGLGPEICVRAIADNADEFADLLVGFAPESKVLPRQLDLSEQLLWADAAITGGGLIKYESGYMGVPAAAIAQNEGQDGETQILSDAGLVFDLGRADSVSDEELARALEAFVSDADRRSDIAARMCDIFVPDPSAHAAQAILEAVRC